MEYTLLSIKQADGNTLCADKKSRDMTGKTVEFDINKIRAFEPASIPFTDSSTEPIEIPYVSSIIVTGSYNSTLGKIDSSVIIASETRIYTFLRNGDLPDE